MNERSDVELSGRQLSAGAIALAEFETRGYSLGDYTIAIRERSNQFEVVFIPAHAPGGATIRGGRTVSGREIHYLITRNGEIAKISYAR